MFETIKQWLRRHWPKLRLRTILLGTFLFVAALPGFSAVFLRVYENTLVRQTESELIAQGAALAAAAGHRAGGPQSPQQLGYYRSETPQIDLSRSPIYQERPNPIGTTALPTPEMELLAQRMAPIIAETGRSTLASVMLLDNQGLVLTGVYRRQSFGHVGEVRAALKGRTITKLRINSSYKPRYDFEWLTRAANLRVHHARPILIDGKVVGVLLLSRSSRALFRGVYQDRAQILLGILVIFAVLIGLTIILHRGIARPIEALSIATRKVAAGQGEIPEPPATAAIEIRALYRDFADMSQSIAHRSRYLRNFAAAVSHEFKTPLASIRGGIELIEDHHGTMTEKERRRFLGNISADAGRLSSLVSRLMDLARADMMKPELDAATELLDVLPSVADAMRIEGFEVEIRCGQDLPPVAMPAATLERVLLGLLENSRQAGASKTQMAANRANGDIVLTIKDDGPGIPENDRERLFEPFFTSKRAEGGTGLGLSIAQSLVEANRGAIVLLPSSKGATFELTLPVATVV